MFGYFKYIKGRRLQSQGKWAEAANFYNEALTGKAGASAEWHYRHGFVLFKLKKWKEAEKSLSVATTLNSKKAQWEFRHAFSLEKLRKWEFALKKYDVAISLQGDRADWHVRRGVCMMALRRWPLAVEAFEAAVMLDPSKADYHYHLADAVRKTGKRWRELEVMETAIGLNSTKASWHSRLAEVQQIMGKTDEAIKSLKRANLLNASDDTRHFQLGLLLEKEGRLGEASVAYEEAVSRSASKHAKQFGVGVLHHDRENWMEAERAYKAKITADPLRAELRYRHARSVERQYRWNESACSYRAALALDPSKADWHYRLGFTLERAQKWGEAAQAYNQAVACSIKHTPHYYYRLGSVLTAASLFEEACHAFAGMQLQQTLDILATFGEDETASESANNLMEEAGERYLVDLRQRKVQLLREALQSDFTRADWHCQLGNALERLSDWSGAAEAYAAAVARRSQHTSGWYYRLGYVLTQCGRFEEACRAYLDSRILKRAYGASQQAYDTNPAIKIGADFTAYSEDLPIAENIVLYESFAGVSISCNPHAIFKHILVREDFAHLTHVWVIVGSGVIPERYKKLSNVIFVVRDSQLYLRYLATAKYVINNATFSPYYVRRPGQIYLNTWHGTPLKALGKHIENSFLDGKNVTRNFLQATHLLSPNAHTTQILTKGYDVEGICSAVIVEAGYPRIDATLNATDAEKAALRDRLGIEPGKKVVLYAPTWRGTLADKEFDAGRLINDLGMLRTLDAAVLFRGHYFIEKNVYDSSVHSSIVPGDIDTNELLAIVDVLITDYSSVAFDFLATGKKIVYYAYDLDDYIAERGMYFDMQNMPGMLCQAIEEVIDAIKSGTDSETRAKLDLGRKEFCPSDDGKVSQRVVDLVFQEKKQGVKIVSYKKKTSLLFFAGAFPPNGITSSMLNLARQLDSEHFDITVALDSAAVASQAECLRQVARLPSHVRVLGRAGRMNQSTEEKWIVDRFNSRFTLETEEMRQLYGGVFRREYRRMFGEARFDVVINFDGYGLFWPSVFVFGPNKGRARRVVYQHNDMLGEFKMRFPSLAGLFSLYPGYDAFISVSKSVCKTNCSAFAEVLNIDSKSFVYCNNLIAPQETLERADDSLPEEDEALFRDGGVHFIAIGRLSPEKDHEKLIRAFSRVLKYRPDARLHILGDGPLRGKLDALVRSMNLTHAVKLLGFRFNPYPYVKRADCMVLSSNHEGQALVLLEAMTLGKPVLSTDIDGPRSVLEAYPELLVENSEDGLEGGMQRFLDGKLAVPSFDAEAYQREALGQFYRHVVGMEPEAASELVSGLAGIGCDAGVPEEAIA